MDILFNPNVEWKNYHNNLDLNINHVNVFKFSVDKVFDQIAPIYRAVLSENELMKANRFIHIEDKQRFVVSKYMLRNMLSKFIPILPASIQFELSPYKKPFVRAGIEFNTTHSNNIVLIAISLNPIGIDIEFVNNNFDYETLIPTVCNERERSFINFGLNKLICFYILWTRKEAILKATGEGLLDNLHELNCMTEIVYRNQTKYYLSSLMLGNEYVTSLAHCFGSEISFWEY